MGIGRKEHTAAWRSQGRPNITEHLEEDGKSETGSTSNTEGKESSYLQRQKGYESFGEAPSMVQSGVGDGEQDKRGCAGSWSHVSLG